MQHKIWCRWTGFQLLGCSSTHRQSFCDGIRWIQLIFVHPWPNGSGTLNMFKLSCFCAHLIYRYLQPFWTEMHTSIESASGASNHKLPLFLQIYNDLSISKCFQCAFHTFPFFIPFIYIYICYTVIVHPFPSFSTKIWWDLDGIRRSWALHQLLGSFREVFQRRHSPWTPCS